MQSRPNSTSWPSTVGSRGCHQQKRCHGSHLCRLVRFSCLEYACRSDKAWQAMTTDAMPHANLPLATRRPVFELVKWVSSLGTLWYFDHLWSLPTSSQNHKFRLERLLNLKRILTRLVPPISKDDAFGRCVAVFRAELGTWTKAARRRTEPQTDKQTLRIAIHELAPHTEQREFAYL